MKEGNHCNGEGCFRIFLLLPKKNIEGNLNTQIHTNKQLFLYSPFPNHYLPQCTRKENRKRTGLVCLAAEKPVQQNCCHSATHVALAFKYARPRMQTDTWHIHVVTKRNLAVEGADNTMLLNYKIQKDWVMLVYHLQISC